MAIQGVQLKFLGVQNATFDENPHENERIRVILGCAISSIASAKYRCTGGWLMLCPHLKLMASPHSYISIDSICKWGNKFYHKLFTYFRKAELCMVKRSERC